MCATTQYTPNFAWLNTHAPIFFWLCYCHFCLTCFCLRVISKCMQNPVCIMHIYHSYQPKHSCSQIQITENDTYFDLHSKVCKILLAEVDAMLLRIQSGMGMGYMYAKFGAQTTNSSCKTIQTSFVCKICAQICLNSHIYSKVWTAFIFAFNSNVVVHSGINGPTIFKNSEPPPNTSN